jgi:hypothetical protein
VTEPARILLLKGEPGTERLATSHRAPDPCNCCGYARAAESIAFHVGLPPWWMFYCIIVAFRFTGPPETKDHARKSR